MRTVRLAVYITMQTELPINRDFLRDVARIVEGYKPTTFEELNSGCFLEVDAEEVDT